jgi:chromosome partitioning protein
VQDGLNRSLAIEGVLMTMFDTRTNLSSEVVKNVVGYFKDKVYRTIIPRNVQLAEAPSHGLPACVYAAESRGAQAYENLAREMLKSG